MSDLPDDDVELTEDEQEALEFFAHHLDMNGIAISSVEDGIVLGINKEKLKELLKIAEESEEGRIVIFVDQGDGPTEPLN